MKASLPAALLLLTFALGAAPALAEGSCPEPNKPAGIIGTPIIGKPRSYRPNVDYGTTVIRVDLSAEGKVLDRKIIESTGNHLVDQAAMRATQTVRYTPEIVDCKAVSGSYLFIVVFPHEQ